jgi:predicted small lipoprotein YifL
VAPDDTRVFARALMVGILLAAVALTGCGRRGPLEAPPGAAAAASADPAAAPAAPVPEPDRPFILDPLL